MLSISSKDNVKIKNTIKLRKSSKHRFNSGSFIAEGVRICMDAYYSKAVIESFFVTKTAINRYPNEFSRLSDYADNTYLLPESLFSLISDTQTPQGFLCVIKALDKISQFDKIKNNGKFLALENIQDPNNLGTILRSAEAFKIDGVILSCDCCDIYSPKVVRGSMGAVFRLPFIICDTISDFLNQNKHLESYSAVVTSDAEKITDVNFSSPCVVVIGNEGNGLRSETIKSCNKSITIPMSGRAESLNASIAASIIMWEMVK